MASTVITTCLLVCTAGDFRQPYAPLPLLVSGTTHRQPQGRRRMGTIPHLESQDHGTESRATHVLGPTIPSGTRPRAAWKARTAASVLAPKLPSTVTPTFAWIC